MYITRDRFGNKFPWERKGKNRECEVRDEKCIIRKCFNPDNVGTIDLKTYKKTIIGKCRTMHEKGCPKNYDDPKNFVTYNEKYIDKKEPKHGR